MQCRQIFAALASAIALATSPALAEPSATPPPVATRTTLAQADATAPTAIEVSKLGAEPRAPLRYDLAAIEPQTLLLIMDLVLDTSTPVNAWTQDTPRLRLWLDMTEVARQADGQLRVVLALRHYDVVPSPSVHPLVQAAIRDHVANLDGFTATLIVNERGRIVASDYANAGDRPLSAQQIGQLEQQLARLTVPLPAVAVGRGAQWTVTQTLAVSGLPVEQVTQFAITDRTANSVTLDMSIRAASLPPSTAGEIGLVRKTLTSVGEGRAQIWFDALVPGLDLALTTRTRVLQQTEDGPQDLAAAVVTAMAVQIGAVQPQFAP